MLRFIFGASGAGKSTRLIKEITERSVGDPDRNFFILVPDQFTMQTQIDVVKAHSARGIMNVDVLSFGRLMHRVFDETGYGQAYEAKDGVRAGMAVLDDTGKNLLLMRIASMHRKELKQIGPMMRSAGFIDEVKSTISEFMQYDISPDDVARLADEAEEGSALRVKLNDLEVLYRAFLDYIETRYLTAEESYVLLSKRLPLSERFKGAVVSFDGFTGFTPIQYRVIRSMLSMGLEVIVTLTLPSEEGAYNAAEGSSLFSLSRSTCADLLRIAWEEEGSLHPGQVPPFDVWKEYRITKDNPDIFLPGDPVPRLKDNPSLAFLEHNLFRYRGEVFDGEPAVSVLSCSTPEEEVRQTMRMIRTMLRDDPSLFYRDFAIVCGDPGVYEEALTVQSGIYDIPLFLDRTVSIRLSPLIEYLKSVFSVLNGNYSYEGVFHYMRSGMTPYPLSDVDLLEHYVRSFGIRGKKAWGDIFTKQFPVPYGAKVPEEVQTARLATVNRMREDLVRAMEPLSPYTRGRCAVSVLCDALTAVLDGAGIDERLEGYAARFEEAGDDERAAEYRQIGEKVRGLLKRMSELLYDEEVTLKEFSELLDAGLSSIEVGSIPQGVDRIPAGDIERTRLREVKYLFFLGVNDNAIPKHAQSGGIITEIERQFLSGRDTGITLAPTARDLAEHQRLYLYLNLTKPSRGLILSYAALDSEKKSIRPAYLVTTLRELFPMLTVRTPEQDAVKEQAVSYADLKRRLPELLRAYADGLMKGDETKAFLTLYGMLLDHTGEEVSAAEDAIPVSALADAAFLRYSDRPLPKHLSAALYGSMLVNSVTRLEKFAACSYAHFVRYGLRLREDETFDLSAADLGNVYHAVLERYTVKMREAGLDLRTVSDDDSNAILTEAVAHVTERYRQTIFFTGARNRQVVERLKRILARTVDTLRYQLSKGDFTPAAAELEFSEVSDAEGIDISLSDEARMRLSGRIDRVDLAEDNDRLYVKVIDFKSSAHDFDIAAVYHGLQLQLVLYLDVAKAAFAKEHRDKEIVPAALMYYRVADPLIKRKADEPETVEALNEAIRKELRVTGLINADGDVLKRLDRTLQGRSDVIPVEINKDGTPGKRSQIATTEEFDLLTRFVNGRIRQLGERILEGEISVDPYEYGDDKACTFCQYRGICGFDPAISGYGYRRLEKTGREETISMIREEMGEA